MYFRKNTESGRHSESKGKWQDMMSEVGGEAEPAILLRL